VHAPEFNGRDGVALWSVWSAKDTAREPESGHLAGQIVYTPLIGKLKQHRQLAESGQGHRIVWAIRRRNEENAFVGRAKMRSIVPAYISAGTLRFARPTEEEPSASAVLSLHAQARPDRRVEPHLRHECFCAGAERGADGGAEELCGFVRAACCGRSWQLPLWLGWLIGDA
jgi:hypothetical protein